MTPENQANYQARMKRINDTIALKEPDRVPLAISQAFYPFYHSPYSIAEIIYDEDLSKTKECMLNYVNTYQPDSVNGVGPMHCGEGKMLELMGVKDMLWSGMPGGIIGDESIHQFRDISILMEDEFDQFFADRTGWNLTRALPRVASAMEPFAKFPIDINLRNYTGLASFFSSPEMKESIQTMWKFSELADRRKQLIRDIHKSLVEAGYPMPHTRMVRVPFDYYSDYVRGTMVTMTDIYDYPDELERYMDEYLEKTIELLQKTKDINPGEHVSMMLHMGMEGFLSTDKYETLYWKYLQKIILAIIDAGKTPYLFCEGKYNSRLDFLTDVPPGKVIYRFETIDYALAKQKLNGIACFSGGFPSYLLDHGTPQQVIDEVKRLLDICAPGGGYQFDTDCSLNNAKPENVEAMFQTVREYGVY